MPKEFGENTRAVHLPPPPVPGQVPLGTPIYRTAAFSFESAEEYADILNGRKPGYSYSRIDNPTADAFARPSPRWRVPAGDAHRRPGVRLGDGRDQRRVLGLRRTRVRTWSVQPPSTAEPTGCCDSLLSRFGVETDFVDITDLDQVAAAIRPTTRIIYAETIANPTMAVADLRALAAHRPRGRGAARGGLHLRPAGRLPPARARRGPGGALGDQVHRRALRRHRRRGRRAAGLIAAIRACADRHRRLARPGRGVPAAPGPGDAAAAGAAAVRDGLGVRRRAGQAPGCRPGRLPGAARPSRARDGPAPVRRGPGGHSVRRHRDRHPARRARGGPGLRRRAAARPGRHLAGRHPHEGQPRGLHHAPADGRRRAGRPRGSIQARCGSPSAWRTPTT